MKPFNTDIIDDLALICGRDKVIKDLKDYAESAENAGIIGSRRFGKTCLLKSIEKYLKSSSSKAYPLYFDAKHEGIINNTNKVYSRITALLASNMCKEGLLEEREYRFGRNFVVYLSSDKNDIEEQFERYSSERQRGALLTMSKVLAKKGLYLLLLIDEIEFLFLNSLSKPADFYKIRTWATTGEPMSMKFWIAGIASWNDITTGVGSSELSGGLEKISLKPLLFKDFNILWENECKLIDNIEKRKCIMNRVKEVFDVSGGVPFYAKTIGKELLKTDYPYELPSSSYTVLRDHFAKIMDNQFLKESERNYLMKLAKGPIVFNEVVPDEIESLKEKGLVVEESGSFVIPIRFLREYILSSAVEAEEESNNVKEEIPIIVDEILRLRDNINKVWAKHCLGEMLRPDGKRYPPFVPSTEDYKEIDALRNVCNNEVLYGAFAGALHRLYYEGSKKSMNLPEGFGPWERSWLYPGESVSEFAMMVNVNRHMFLHREYEPSEKISMSDEDFLNIINEGKRPESPQDFMLMQYHLLLRCKGELHRMLVYLYEKVK